VKASRTLDPSAKRAAILAAGEILFASAGFARTTMAQIAAKADVAVGSLYRAFPDKLALLTALHSEMEQKFVNAILRSWDIDRPPEQRFRAMIEALMAQVSAARASMPLYMLTRDLVSSGGQEPGAKTVAVIARLYEAGVQRGEFVATQPALAAAIAYGMVEGGIRDWMTSTSQAAEYQTAVDVMTRFFVRAFVLP
jgi:AcrR family transcriptional regulator